MSSKILKEEIANKLSVLLDSYGYDRKGRSFRWFKPQFFGWDYIDLIFKHYGDSTRMKIVVCRRFEDVERVLGPFFQKPNYYRNDGSDVTLAFSANQVNGINEATKVYDFSLSDYDQALNQIQTDFLTKIHPVLEQTNSIHKLNEFINNPPETFEEKVYFFPLDGGTLYRKMIIAKLVDINYELVCNFVINFFKAVIATGGKLNPIYDHLQIYHDLKSHLDHNVQPQNV